MSDPMDALIPPKQADFALVPLEEPDEELDGELEELDSYAYNTDRQMWCCLQCGSPVFDTLLHTSWHNDLDKLLTGG